MISKKTRKYKIKLTIAVFEFPPSESFKSLVSLELRYGMCVLFPSTNAEITFPKTESDWLILLASLSLSPVAWVRLSRSDPARSTRFSFPILVFLSCRFLDSTRMVNIAWERELTSFMSVERVMRLVLPRFMSSVIDSIESTGNPMRSFTKTPTSTRSRTSSFALGSGARRSSERKVY